MHPAGDGNEMKEVSTMSSARIALLVPGMHRSGTSALSGMLVKLGAQDPKSLMAPTEDNPRGYWESTALMRFHDEVLKSGGTVWSDWDQFNADWMESAVAGDFFARMPGILEQEYGDARLLLVKDPRMCRLLPIWLRVLAGLEITPKFIVPFRHPFEVARSLEVRNDFGRNRAYLIWLRHVLDAEFQSRGYNRVFVEYAALLADWRTQSKRISDGLNLSWPKWSARVEADIDMFLSAELRHHGAESTRPGGTGIAGWVATAYDSLKLLASGGEEIEKATSQLDELRAELDSSSAIYASVLRESEVRFQSQMQSLNKRLDDATNEYGALATQCSEAKISEEAREAVLKAAQVDSDSRIAGLEQQHAALGATLGEITDQRDSLESARVELASRNAVLVSTLGEISEQRDSLESARAELAAEQAVLVSTLGEITEQRDSLETALADQASRHQAEIARLHQAQAEVEQSLQARFSEIAKLTSMVFELESALASERASHVSNVAEGNARLAWRERELELCRRRSLERQRLQEATQADPFWRGGDRLRRWIGKPSRIGVDAPVLDDAKAIAKSGLFDRAWYLERYGDVRRGGMDPLKHYVRYGAAEGRDPGAGFSTSGYLARYPDVAASGLNPLLHYVQYGIWEGRAPRGSKNEVVGR